MNRNYDLTRIEEAMQDAVKALGISRKVYCNRPKAVPDSVMDFVVVRVSGILRDYEPYAECSVSISLFAKDVENIKNGKKLSAMQRKLIDGLGGSYGSILLGRHPRVLGDTMDKFGFHARVIQFNNVTIKSV